jgi:hypothetical protein
MKDLHEPLINVKELKNHQNEKTIVVQDLCEHTEVFVKGQDQENRMIANILSFDGWGMCTIQNRVDQIIRDKTTNCDLMTL